MRVPKTPADAWRALSGGPLPWHQTLLYGYFVVDMLAEPLSRKAVLDQVSRVGLMRDRWYMVDAIPAMEAENVLKALKDAGLVDLTRSGGEVTGLISDVPYYRDLYETLGKAWRERHPSQLEEEIVAVIDRLAQGPCRRSRW